MRLSKQKGEKRASFVSDGDIFDPLDPATLNDLRVPDFPKHGGMSMNVTLDLSYILKQRCEMHSERQFAGLFIQKTLDMMAASPIRWLRSDYLRVILVFYQFGMFVEGDKFESTFRRQNPQIFSSPFDESLEGKSLETKYYFEQKWHRHQEHETLRRLVPDLTPETYKGYAQILGRRTKRYLALIEEAMKFGFAPDPGTDKHFCRKYDRHVKMEMQYDASGKSPRLLYCECPLHAAGDCDGKNDFGLLCIYPSTNK